MVLDFINAHLELVSELAGLMLVLGVVVTFGGALIARFDGISLGNGIYFAFITALTVGFGDLVPKSGAAKIITIILALIGLIVLGIVVAVSTHALDIALGLS